MTVLGIDFSWGRPGAAAIKAAGYSFVVRYVPYAGDGGKGLSKPERNDLHANGISVALVFERTAGRMFDGEPAGIADALTARTAMVALGFPADRPVYFACDVDVKPGMFEYIDDYLLGVAAVLPGARIGVYGEYDVIEYVLENGLAIWAWQTYAWSGGKKHPDRHIYQYLNGQTFDGAAVDYNEAYGTDYGQWPVEEEMGMTDDEKLAIFAGKEQAIARPTREVRLKYANDRIAEIAAGKAPSIQEIAAGAAVRVDAHIEERHVAGVTDYEGIGAIVEKAGAAIRVKGHGR